MTVVFRGYWDGKVASEEKLENCPMFVIALVSKKFLHLMVSRCMPMLFLGAVFIQVL